MAACHVAGGADMGSAQGRGGTEVRGAEVGAELIPWESLQVWVPKCNRKKALFFFLRMFFSPFKKAKL